MQSLDPSKKLKSTEDLFPIDLLNKDVKDEIEKIKVIEEQIIRDNLIKKKQIKNDKADGFLRFRTIRSFGRDIWNCIITLKDAIEEQTNLKNEIIS